MSFRRFLYSLCVYLIFPFVLLRLLWRSRGNVAYRKRLSERLGFVSRRNRLCLDQLSSESTLWLHAVSVGETIAAKPLVEALLASYPKCTILMTTTTPTGSDRVVSLFADHIKTQRMIHVYFPYDLLGAVSRFIQSFKPSMLIVVETEIWPNLYAKCHQQKIPVLMVNARLSERSTQSYLKIKTLVEETLSKVSTVAVRSKQDADRFLSLGVRPDQIQEIGNIKYDISIDKNQLARGKNYVDSWNKGVDKTRLVFVAASTHKGEDEQIIRIYLNLLKHTPELMLVLVPRHPERFDDVYRDCLAQLPDHLIFIRHSDNVDENIDDGVDGNIGNSLVNKVDSKRDLQSANKTADVILGDSMGEMQMWFATADVVFMGGSLVKTGGHNPLEATVFGVPVVSGPHMFNFDDVASELSASDLLFVCEDEESVTQKLSQLLLGKNKGGTEYLEKAEKFMQQHRGVTARLVYLVSKLP